MPAIHIRNVPESTLIALRERAARHGRSMQQELLSILDSAAAEPIATRPFVTTRTSTTATWRREHIYNDEGR